MRFNTRSEAALYLWDYFYLAEAPAPGDEKPWAFIERAVCRLRAAEPYLDPPAPLDVRGRSARRIRSAARVAMRHIGSLAVKPEPWTLEQLVTFEALADDMIQTLAVSARHLVLD